MTQDELKAAYERFDKMSDDDIERLDGLCAALQNYRGNVHQKDRDGIILPNRVCAMLAAEAMMAWEEAECGRQ